MLAGALLILALLQAAPATGVLRVKSDVSEVEVFLDGTSAGKTPLTMTAVAAGAHRVSLTKPGYEDREEQVTVEAGATAKLFVVMKPLPQAPPQLPAQFYVIHQHRAGACSGILTVTAEAVDYRSLDGKDVFHIPIAAMRSVSRSMGALPNVAWNMPHEYLGCRIEGPGRSYGFFAYEEDPKLAGTPAENRVKFVDTAVKTKELFELVYRLWSETLKPKKK
jgi:hypothetical protein